MFGKTPASPRMRGTRAARSEHRAEAARTELAQAWKQRFISKGGGAASAVPAAGAAAVVADGQLRYEDEEEQ